MTTSNQFVSHHHGNKLFLIKVEELISQLMRTGTIATTGFDFARYSHACHLIKDITISNNNGNVD